MSPSCPMIRPKLTLAVAALVAASTLAACDDDSGHRHRRHHSSHGYTTIGERGSIYVRKNDLYIDADDADTAVIHADASLSIDDKDITVTPDARKALNAYRAAYKALAEAGISIGLDGVDLAADTFSGVLHGLADGSVDKAGDEADRRGKAIEAKVRGLCDRMGDLRTAQESVVAKVAEFKPYAIVDADEVARCYADKHGDEAGHDTDEVPTPPTPVTPPNPATPPTPPTPPKPGKGTAFNFDVREQNWSIRDGSVVIEPKDEKAATVSGDGVFKVGSHEVSVDDAAREALRDYNRQARRVENEIEGLGLAASDMAIGAVGGALRGVFGGDDKATKADMERSGAKMKARIARMCARLADMRAAQETAVVEAPEFSPYAVVTEKNVRDCGVHKDTKSNADDDKS